MGSYSLKNDSERDERYLKLEVGTTRVRVLDEKPQSKWTHWINQKPYNCPGPRGGCPACLERNALKQTNPEAAKNLHRLQRVGVVNVAVYGEDKDAEPEVRILAFPSSLGDALDTLEEEYGDLRGYDVKIKKTKDGNRAWDVSYAATAPKDDWWKPEYDGLKENRYDVVTECLPAKVADISAAIRGLAQSEADTDDDEPKGESPAAAEGPTKASALTLKRLEEAMRKHGDHLTYADFGIDKKTVTEAEALDYISDLKKTEE